MASVINELLYSHLSPGKDANFLLAALGICSLCRNEAMVTDMKNVVSRSFTEWEQFVSPYALCKSCAWVLSDKELRLHSMMIVDNILTVDPCPHAFLNLANLDNVSLIVPASKQKQLAYHADYGMITTDYGNFPLVYDYRVIVQTLVRLRMLGLSESALHLVDAPHELPSRTIAVIRDLSEFFGLLELSSQAKSRTPELFHTAVLLSRFTYCSANCPPRGVA